MTSAKRDGLAILGAAKAKLGMATMDIIDIRCRHAELNLQKEVERMMNPINGPKELPTLLLYDEKGLQLFEDITYLDEYYLTNCEIDVLRCYATDMASKIPDGAVVVELGSGNLRKVCLLLQAFENAGKTIDYYALDLSQEELQRTLSQVPHFKHVSCHGLFGTYDDGRDWLSGMKDDRPRCILHMGSSIGNFTQAEAVDFLKQFSDVMKPQDLILIGVDSWNQPDKVYHAYNDSQGVTHKFILNGLANANRIFNREIFHLPDWRVHGEYVYDSDEGGRHQAFVFPIRDVTVLDQRVHAFERIKIEQSIKYSQLGSEKLFSFAGLEKLERWTVDNEYGLSLLKKSPTPFPQTSPALYAAHPLPSLHDWSALWKAWNTVTRQMLPDDELSDKPIRLRNACIFYLGHIPTFLDIQLTKTTGTAPTSPAWFYDIFERGIDPDVDDPEKCHQHSEIPDEWPPLEDIIAYQDRVRERLRSLYGTSEEGQKGLYIPRNVGRAIWLGFEHELMHIETLLYMMLQSSKTLPPPDVPRPDFEKLAREAADAAVENEWFDIPAQRVSIGMDDPEDGTDVDVHYGWDNEKPLREADVHAFQAKGRAITNGEYCRYMIASKVDHIPASWSTTTDETTTPVTDGDNHISGSLPPSFLENKYIRTVYGLIPLKYALDWPVMASYDELSGCAAWMGGRIPTFEEARSIYAYVDGLKKKKETLNGKLANRVPAVNGHLVNDGVEETPPSPASTPDLTNSANANTNGSLFIDLSSSSTAVGFKHWHPAPVTPHGNRLAGQSGLGGVWEWTSTTLAAHEGFEPMPMYPGYTADFFDGLHNIVLGGSWATHPRIAGRKSFVNWYQRKYPYAWVGARLVRDI